MIVRRTAQKKKEKKYTFVKIIKCMLMLVKGHQLKYNERFMSKKRFRVSPKSTETRNDLLRIETRNEHSTILCLILHP